MAPTSIICRGSPAPRARQPSRAAALQRLHIHFEQWSAVLRLADMKKTFRGGRSGADGAGHLLLHRRMSPLSTAASRDSFLPVVEDGHRIWSAPSTATCRRQQRAVHSKDGLFSVVAADQDHGLRPPPPARNCLLAAVEKRLNSSMNSRVPLPSCASARAPRRSFQVGHAEKTADNARSGDEGGGGEQQRDGGLAVPGASPQDDGGRTPFATMRPSGPSAITMVCQHRVRIWVAGGRQRPVAQSDAKSLDSKQVAMAALLHQKSSGGFPRSHFSSSLTGCATSAKGQVVAGIADIGQTADIDVMGVMIAISANGLAWSGPGHSRRPCACPAKHGAARRDCHAIVDNWC